MPSFFTDLVHLASVNFELNVSYEFLTSLTSAAWEFLLLFFQLLSTKNKNPHHVYYR